MDIGVAVMPVEFAQRGVQEKKLVRIFDDWHLPEVEYFAKWPEKSHRQGLVSVFVDFLSDYLRDETPQTPSSSAGTLQLPPFA